MIAEGESVNEFEEDAVRPKCDVDTDETTGKEIENDAGRPKCDLDAEEMTDNEIEKDAVRPKSDMDAGAVDENAKNKQERENEATAAKKILEVDEEVSIQDVEIRRRIEERKNTAKGDKQRLKELSTHFRKYI